MSSAQICTYTFLCPSPTLTRMQVESLSLDPSKYQFISIDDEDLKAVQIFLISKKMSGWGGGDTSSARISLTCLIR